MRGTRAIFKEYAVPCPCFAFMRRFAWIALAACAALPLTAAAEAPPAPLTLERLYALPRLIGTAPSGFTWSPDARHLAFLWNDEGTNFRDVWILDAGAERPRRITALPRPLGGSATDAVVARREADVAAERDEGVETVAWHPDGKQLIVTLRGKVHRLAATAEAATTLDAGIVAVRHAVSPDGRRIAFVTDGAVFLQAWAASRTGDAVAPTRLLARTSPTTTPTRLEWSPDGKHIAIVESDRGAVRMRAIPDYLPDEARMREVPRAFPGEPAERRRVGIIDVDTTLVRWLALGGNAEDLVLTLAWSPDARELLIDGSDLYVKHRRLLIASASDGRVETWLEERDPRNVSADWWAAWAPDGRGIYYTSDRDEDYHVYLRARRGGAAKRITRGDWAVDDVQLVPAARALFISGNLGKPEERHLFRVPLAGGAPQRLTRSAGSHFVTVSPDGRLAAGEFSSDTVPPDLFVTELAGSPSDPGAERRITRSPLAAFVEHRWAPTRYVTFRSPVDGATLHGRLTVPPDFDASRGRYPAIIGSIYSNTVRNRWGGRVAHPTWGLDHYLAQQGFVLLNIDVAGSSGHGKAFRQRILLDYGGIDIADIEAGARWLASTGFVDERRLGIWGSSYGGLMTVMAMATRPGLFRAGVAGAPATNVRHALTGEMRVMGRPQDHADAYDRASAYTQAEQLEGALMIIHGMRDDVVLYRDSVALTHKLMLLGKDVELVTLPDAGHGWDNEGLYQTIHAFQRLVGHFERHLGSGPR